jgi:hypothetical protein
LDFFSCGKSSEQRNRIPSGDWTTTTSVFLDRLHRVTLVIYI